MPLAHRHGDDVRRGHAYLLGIDRNTTIVFHCHHGIRSQSAAEYLLREEGFRNLYNLRVESTPGPSWWIRPNPAIEVRPRNLEVCGMDDFPRPVEFVPRADVYREPE